MVTPTGYTALDLVGFTDRGAYDGNANYVKNDLVHHGGNVWRVLADDITGIIPSEGANYTLFIGEPTNLVERIIAPLEISPSEHAWTIGRQFIYNDLLYEVIDTIAIGDGLVAYESDPTNANIKLALPVETQLLALKTLNEAVVDTIAPTETSPATAAHAVEKQLFYNGTLYTVISPIAIGDTLVIGTNITESDTIVDQLGSHKGHVIKNSSGISMTDRTALQFENGYVEDDSVNDKTIVRSTNFVGTLAQWNALTLAEQIKYKTADITDDFNGSPIDSALSSTSTNPVQNRVITEALEKREVCVLTLNSVSSLPQTITNAGIENDMVVVNAVLSSPSSQLSDWNVAAGSGTLTISGTISGTTDVTLYLQKSNKEPVNGVTNSVIKGNDSGWKVASGNDGNAVSYRKIGNIVYVKRKNIGTVPINTSTVIGILPEGYRLNNFANFVVRADSEALTTISIDNTGEIKLKTTAVANFIPPFCISFLTN